MKDKFKLVKVNVDENQEIAAKYGVGLTLATIDQIKLAGGMAGDFLDLGGTDDPARVAVCSSCVLCKHKYNICYFACSFCTAL